MFQPKLSSRPSRQCLNRLTLHFKKRIFLFTALSLVRCAQLDEDLDSNESLAQDSFGSPEQQLGQTSAATTPGAPNNGASPDATSTDLSGNPPLNGSQTNPQQPSSPGEATSSPTSSPVKGSAGPNPGDPSAPENIQYFGRFQFAGETATVGWNASYVKVFTDGGVLSTTFSGVADWDVVVDGGEATRFSQSGTQAITSALGADSTHIIELRKRSEGRGVAASLGPFTVAGGELIAPTEAVPDLSIEFYGDSWLAGYGSTRNDDSSTSSLSWNGSLSYGPIAARALGAEYRVQAWGGQGWLTGFPDDKAKRALQHETTPYDTSLWRPDLVVVEMGKNDGHVAGIREPAVAFIDWLLDSYGQDVAIVLVAVDAQPIYDQIFSDRSATAENLFLYKGFNTGDDVPVSGQVLGHPSYSQHQAMATKLESYLRSDVLPEITF